MAIPDLSVGGFPRYPIFGNVAVRLDTGLVELWDGVSAWISPAAPPPTGSIVAWPTAVPPSGWLVCNGAAVSRATYAALFALVGVTFGPGDGATTFNLPDLRDRFVKGENGDGAGAVGGSSAPSVVVTDPGHVHTVSANVPRTNPGGAANTASTQNTGSSATGITASIADGRPPYMALAWVVKT